MLRTSLLGSRKAIVRDFSLVLPSIAIAQNRVSAAGRDQARIPDQILGNGRYSTWERACFPAAPALGLRSVPSATEA